MHWLRLPMIPLARTAPTSMALSMPPYAIPSVARPPTGPIFAKYAWPRQHRWAGRRDSSRGDRRLTSLAASASAPASGSVSARRSGGTRQAQDETTAPGRLILSIPRLGGSPGRRARFALDAKAKRDDVSNAILARGAGHPVSAKRSLAGRRHRGRGASLIAGSVRWRWADRLVVEVPVD